MPFGFNSISPYSPHGRSTLNQWIIPGQNYRSGSIWGFNSGPRVVNNFYGNYGSHDYHGSDFGMPKWTKWFMGFGMGFNFLGNLFSGIFGGGGSSSDGAGGTGKTLTDAQMQDLAAYKSAVSDVKVLSQKADGKFLVEYTDDDGKKIHKEMAYGELMDLYKSKFENSETETPGKTETAKPTNKQIQGSLQTTNVVNNNDNWIKDTDECGNPCEVLSENGKVIARRYKDKDGNVEDVEEYEYDNITGNKTNDVMTDYDALGNKRYIREITYDATTGNKTNDVMTDYDALGNKKSIWEITYDATTGNETNDVITYYDAKGNIIKIDNN